MEKLFVLTSLIGSVFLAVFIYNLSCTLLSFHVLCQCQMSMVRCSQLQIWLLTYCTNSYFSTLNPSSYPFYGTPKFIISLPFQETSLRLLFLDQCHRDYFFRSLIMDQSSLPKQAISVNLGHPHASGYCSINFHFLVSFSPCSFSPFLNPSRLMKTAYVKYPHETFFLASCFPSLTSKNAKEVAW